MPSCDALGGAVVGHEPEFGVTSLMGFLTSPRIPVHVQLLHPQVHHRMASSTISPRKKYFEYSFCSMLDDFPIIRNISL